MEAVTKILSGSIELFRQYGFKTITMDDIARKAGISKKTLYQHFANKNEVVKEAVSFYKGLIHDSCCKMMDESENAVEAMVKIMGMFDHMNRQMNPLSMLELERYFPDAYSHFRNMLQEQDVHSIKKNMERGISEGLYREEIDADFMAKYRIELSLIMYHNNLLVNERRDLQFVGHEVNEHFMYGIMTAKGVKLYHKYKEKFFKQVPKL